MKLRFFSCECGLRASKNFLYLFEDILLSLYNACEEFCFQNMIIFSIKKTTRTQRYEEKEIYVYAVYLLDVTLALEGSAAFK